VPRTVHVICGDAGGLTKGLAVSSKDMVSLCDYLPSGPVRGFSDLESWRAARLAFWEGVYAAAAERPKQRRKCAKHWAVHPVIPEPERLIDASEVVLWLGTGLAEQLMLTWMPQFLRAVGARGAKLHVVQFERNSSGVGISEVAYVTSDEIRAAPAVRALGDTEFAYLDVAWRAITCSEPDTLLRLLHDDSAALPILRAALRRVLWRFPDFRSGVSRQDAQLLSSTRDHGPAAASVVGRSVIALENEGDRAGDLLLWWRLRRLADPALPHPAVTIAGVQGWIAGAEVNLTSVGERIARGELNFVELNGIDDWVGGVHLDSRVGDVWFRRDDALIRR
jgi:hypothetical protein